MYTLYRTRCLISDLDGSLGSRYFVTQKDFKLPQNAGSRRDDTGIIFSQPPLISFKLDKNMGNFLVRSAFQTSHQPETFKRSHARCKTCPFVRNVEKISTAGPRRSTQDHWSFYLYLSQGHLMHNLHSLQKVKHRWNRETTRRPIRGTPSWRRERRQKRIPTGRDTLKSPQSLEATCGSLRPFPTSGKHWRTQNSRTCKKLFFKSTLLILTVSSFSFN